MELRRKLVPALVAALTIASVAAPSGAATAAIDDAPGDVTDENGSATSDPRVDITGVTFENAIDGLTLTIKVADVVPFSDDAWLSGELLVGAGLDERTNVGELAEYSWLLIPDGIGGAFGLLGQTEGTSACFTDATQTSTAYVLSAGRQCASALPRELAYGAVALAFSDEFAIDVAPDGADLSGPLAAADRGFVRRLAGTDRTLTAISLSQDVFDDGTAGGVVLAAAMNFPDALAGGPLAAYTGSPLLLTGSEGLDSRVLAEIRRVLEPNGTVYVLGGTAALSDKVVSDVRAAGYTPKRVAGLNRFETATAIADEISSLGFEHDLVLVADGMVFTDALVAGAAAPSLWGVVLLTNGSTMPAATDDYLRNDTADRVAIGAAAASAAGGVRSITGATPSELSVNVANDLLPIRGSVAVASQAVFADALAGGPHIAASVGPLLLTDPQALSTAARDAIEAADGTLRQVVVYGGTAAVSAGVLDAITAALAP